MKPLATRDFQFWKRELVNISKNEKESSMCRGLGGHEEQASGMSLMRQHCAYFGSSAPFLAVLRILCDGCVGCDCGPTGTILPWYKPHERRREA